MPNPANTSVFIQSSKRSIILPGMAADRFYDFAVRAYRRVDSDINADGVIYSTLTAAKNLRYRPSAQVSFNGNVTGTINDVAASQVIADLKGMTADNVLSRVEKSQVSLVYSQMLASFNASDAKATQLGGIESQRDASRTAVTAFTNYLTGLKPAYNDLSKDTPIDGAEFQTKYATAVAALADLDAMIADRASQLALWNGVTGPGKPQDNATVGAPVGTNVGGRPVEDLLAGVDKSKLDIDALIATFGDTASAATSANAAKDAAQTAATAKDESKAARDAAQSAQNKAGDYAGQADASRALSEAARSIADIARQQAQDASSAAGQAKSSAAASADAAAISKGDANGFARTAEGQAAIAIQKSSDAGQSASLAKASLDKAETARSGAESARDSAVTARDSATGSSASSASSAKISAKASMEAINGILSEGRSPGASPGAWSWNAYNTFAPAANLNDLVGGEQVIVNGLLRVANGLHVHPVAPTPVLAGRVYKPRARVRLISDEGVQGGGHSLYVTYWDKDGNLLGGNTQTAAALDPLAVTVAQGYFELEGRPFSLDGKDGSGALIAGTAFMRVMYRTASQCVTEIASIYIEDITESMSAAKSASASSGSAATAAASADTAGQRASASDTSRQKAETAQGLAEAAKSAAAISESNASGSAQRASSSESLTASTASIAGRALAAQFPRTMDAQAFMVNPASNVLTEQSFINPAAVVDGKVIMDTVNAPIYPYGLWMRGYLPYEAGKTYEVHGQAAWVSGAGDNQPAVIFYYNLYNANGDLIGETVLGNLATLSAGVRTPLTATHTLPVYPAAAYIRFALLTNRNPANAGALTVGRTDIYSLYPVDITDSLASKKSADASSISASQALASEGKSGQSASAAGTSRDEASTSAGQALAYRNTAAESQRNAEKAATSATLASGVSARAALDGSANSANNNRSPGAAMSLWSYNNYNTFDPPTRLTDNPATFSSVAGNLRANSGVHVHPVAPMRIEPSKRYRVFARYRLTEEGPQTNAHYLYLSCFDNNGGILTGNVVAVAASAKVLTVADGFFDLAADVSTDGKGGSYQLPAGTAFIRPMYRTSGTPEEVALIYAEDVESQLASGAAATAASGFASRAEASESKAGQSASAADGYRNQAETSYGKADASRAAAAISESNAAGSKNSAATSADLSASAKSSAEATVASALPSTFSQGPQFWSANYSGPDIRDKAIPAHYHFEKDTGVLRADGGGFNDIAHLGSIPLVKGRRRRLTAVWNTIYAGGLPSVNATLFAIGMNGDMVANYTPGKTVSIAGSGPGWGDPNGFKVDTFEFNDDDLLVNGAVRVRGLFRYNNDNGIQQWRLKSFLLEDITSEAASSGFANASLGSSQAASASADTAGQRASAAEGSRLAAVTAQGKAETARDTAVTSNSNAQGSEQRAASSAKLSAKVGGTRGVTLNGDFASSEGWGSNCSYGDWYLGKGYRAGPGQIGNVSAIDMVQIDVNKKYRLNARFAIHGASAEIYAGIVCYDVNRQFLGNVYIPAYVNIRYAGGVYSDSGEYVGQNQPRGYGHGSSFVAGTVYVTPLALLNYAGDQVSVDCAALYLEEVTSEIASRGSASAANGSASTASASEGAAGRSADAANQSRIDAEAANGRAQGSASAASGSAVAADASRSAAQTSATIASSYSSTAVTLNDKFANWPVPTDYPTGWILWDSQSNFRFSRVQGMGSAFAAYMQCDGANFQGGFRQIIRVFPGKWVMEATVRLDANVWTGAGIHCDSGFNIHFATVRDTNGKVGGDVGGTRTWSAMFDIGTETDMNFYLMHGWPGFGDVAPKYLTWFMARMRPATQMEIDAGKALANANVNAARIEAVNESISNEVGSLGRRTASVEATSGNLVARTGVVETAVASANNRLAAARLELSAVTPGGRASLTLRSDNNGGAGVDIVGDTTFKGSLDVGADSGGNRVKITNSGFQIFDGNGTLRAQFGLF